MLPSVLLALALPIWLSTAKIIGVHPSLESRYFPAKGKSPGSWKCLDGSKEILFSAVNDDYCDCPDGSDEPGTGACTNSSFYCLNYGHVGMSIPSSRVRDGLCEPECCDGSDEDPGVCPNRCKEVGEEHAIKIEAESKIRRTGSKIRSTYIVFAQKEKKRLETMIANLEVDIKKATAELDSLKEIKDMTENLSAAETELKKQSPLYQSLEIHKHALLSFRRVYDKLKKRDEALSDILNNLREGYNPNYQDMAVLEAVRGWEALENLPPKGHEDEKLADGNDMTSEEQEELLEPGAWTEDQLEHQLSGLVDQDYLALLLSHETYLESLSETSPLMDLASYLPDSWIPYLTQTGSRFLELLRTIGVVRGGPAASEQAANALAAFTEEENKLNGLKKKYEDAKDELKDLFDPKVFGAEGEWKKLDGLCLEKDTGEYVYEVCLFDKATQKSKTGGQHSLGTFKSWDEGLKPTDEAYYNKQFYKHGAQCWNGPQRSVTLELRCGTENILQIVTEPEKCEYHITGESPALCSPPSAEPSVKAEL